MTSAVCKLRGRLIWLLVSIPVAAWVLLSVMAGADVGDPLSRIQCPPGYNVTIYAEGLSSPDGLALNPDGVLYVAEEKGGRVSRIESYGVVTTILSGLVSPEGIAFDAAGNLYVVEDSSGGRVIKMTPEGLTTTLATDRDAPEGVVWSPDGTLYITESNVQFTDPVTMPLNVRTHVTAISSGGDVTRIRTDALWWSYAGITIGPAGSLYVTNEASGAGTDDSVFVVDAVTGSRTLFASGLQGPEGLRFSSNGGFPLYVIEEDAGGSGGRLSRVQADGNHAPLCTGFDILEDVVVDQAGRLYVSEDGMGLVIRIEPGLPDRAPARAIILFIGAGMGEAQRTAARWSEVGRNGALAMDRKPYGSWARTGSLPPGTITDSAAAATALATGVKTINGVIGQDPDGYLLTTILERAQASGWAVGLVTNAQMAHATPAAFAAHVPDRVMMTEIASQMLAADVNVLLGGGEDEFLPTSAIGRYPQPGKRTDGRNLIAEAVAAGYTYVYDAPGLAAVVPTSTTHLLGLFADESLDRPFTPSLAQMAQQAIDVLSQDPDGFFLMVEGGQIDGAGHANDAANVISDTLGFDEAITVAQTYASTTGDVLIIVTGDHETGGMRVTLAPTGAPDEDGPFSMPGGAPFFVNWTTTDHTAADVPTTAQGPWSDLLVGTVENSYLHDVMRLALESSPAISLTQMTIPPEGAPVRPGDRITYTLVLTNNGVADATGLSLTDTLPTAASFVPGSARASVGLQVAAVAPPALVFTGRLPAGQTLTATLAVTVTPVPSGTLLVNEAEVTATRSAVVADTAAHPVVVFSSLSISKTAVPPSGSRVAAGEWITYTVVARNSGKAVTGVVLADALDLTNVTLGFSHTSAGLLSGPNPVRVTDLDLDSGQSVTLTLGVTVSGEVSGAIISNRASITSAETPLPQFSHWVTHVISHTHVILLPIISR